MMRFTDPHFTDQDKALEYLERLRWADGPNCPHCGSLKHYRTKRYGRYRCAEKECRKDFSATTGTVMEASHIKLTTWLMAFYLMASSKKGMSAHQLHRSLGITYKSAWFLAHRIRLAMKAGGLGTLGGSGKIVEVDETYHGKVETPRAHGAYGRPFTKGGRSGPSNKRAIVSLVERGGSVRSFHVKSADKATVQKIIVENVSTLSRLHTDESGLYTGAGFIFSTHETVKHSAKEYARGDVTANTVEGFFGVFKRGMRGVYQHCAEKHLHRYLSEFDFRYNARKITDGERAALALQGAEGKRLTYRQSH